MLALYGSGFRKDGLSLTGRAGWRGRLLTLALAIVTLAAVATAVWPAWLARRVDTGSALYRRRTGFSNVYAIAPAGERQPDPGVVGGWVTVGGFYEGGALAGSEVRAARSPALAGVYRDDCRNIRAR